jgi:hypothetical protein
VRESERESVAQSERDSKRESERARERESERARARESERVRERESTRAMERESSADCLNCFGRGLLRLSRRLFWRFHFSIPLKYLMNVGLDIRLISGCGGPVRSDKNFGYDIFLLVVMYENKNK